MTLPPRLAAIAALAMAGIGARVAVIDHDPGPRRPINPNRVDAADMEPEDFDLRGTFSRLFRQSDKPVRSPRRNVVHIVTPEVRGKRAKRRDAGKKKGR